MLGTITGILKVRWLPYVLLGAMVSLLAVYGYGRVTGYDAGVLHMTTQMDKALTRQHKRMTQLIKEEGQLVLLAERKKNGVQKNINRVDGRSCSISVECLQFYDNVLRASTTHDRELEIAVHGSRISF